MVTHKNEVGLNISIAENNKCSFYDIETGIHNKYYMKEKVNEYLKSNECNNGEIAALILIDIDNFNIINDMFNYNIGDEILIAIAHRLNNMVCDEDIICRYSGDEFIIFKKDFNDIDSVKSFATRVLKVLEEPFRILDEDINITSSIGLALYPHNGECFEMLLKSADAAMHSSKKKGKNGYTFFDNSISVEVTRIYNLKRCLKKALENKELFVVFQPKISLSDYRMHGMEALLRWESNELGLIYPSEMIPIAEATRLIVPIGKFVLEEVFKKVKELIEEGQEDFKIAVNLSELQLRYSAVFKDFEEFSLKYEVPLKYIEVEITESILMREADKNIDTLNKIRDLGASIALDDFGTGYSSYSYLKNLPVDILKIDKSFIDDVTQNNKSKCIVESIIALSHSLGIEVVAEGVENKEQALYLKKVKCDVIQGYYYSKPYEFKKVKNMFKEDFKPDII
ncbi:putative bifunctional diguanylate cyclase/phosphodiesterase [Clostridium sp.]|uniref:putative bifunctional diguanylate cyclase/phosphodiesterase n=1 Tax=Clostridium sp. TaxID=1506 RepID=UPI002FCB9921